MAALKKSTENHPKSEIRAAMPRMYLDESFWTHMPAYIHKKLPVHTHPIYINSGGGNVE